MLFYSEAQSTENFLKMRSLLIIIKINCNYLFTSDTRVSVCGGSKHKVVQHGSIRCDTNTTADHHSDLELVPILIATTKRSFYSYFRMLVLRVVVAGIEVITQFPSPWPLCFNVTREEILVRCRSQGERMKLVRSKRGARKANPLTRQIFQIRWPVEFDFYHVRW